jgi:26S proteasome regulatory subunit N10
LFVDSINYSQSITYIPSINYLPTYLHTYNQSINQSITYVHLIMPLESCMILLDNSEYMRNGDYIPTRLEAQVDAANLLVGAKTQSHPESTVGVSAGTDLLVSPTEDVGKILNALHGVPMVSRKSDVTASVQVASLALKHRRNKNGSQRIVLFVGSPLEGIEPRALAKAGRQLKKNNVAIDVVAMGELAQNEDKLKELVEAANGRADDGQERTCHLVTIPSGVLPSDVLASSPIVHGGSGGSAFAASAAVAAATGNTGDMGGGFSDFGGVDANMDPELAMALRVSMEEERARQERLAAQQAQQQPEESKSGEESKDADMADAPPPAAAAFAAAQTASMAAMDMGLSEEEALLQQALAMSMNENEPTSNSSDSKPAATTNAMEEDDDEAAAMQLALQMSMQTELPNSSNSDDVRDIVSNLPGVNANDPAIQNALKNLEDSEDDDKKKNSDKK